MKNEGDPLTISDDDSDHQTHISQQNKISKRRLTSRTLGVIETIDLDNYLPQHSSIRTNNDFLLTLQNNPYTENELLREVIHKCLNLESSQGMLRIINRTLLCLYNNVDEQYKKSTQLEEMLQKIIQLLNVEPNRKFSHMKTLCEELKLHQFKKRAQLITLETNLRADSNGNKLKHNGDLMNAGIKKPKFDNVIIDLDNETDVNTNVINIDNDQSEIIIVDEDVRENEKENIGGQFTEKSDEYLLPVVEIVCNNTNSETNNYEIMEELPITYEPEIEPIEEQIKELENKIAANIATLTKLDEEEVNVDSMNSPYIKSEKIKLKIVSLYEELCKLTGQNAVKRRTIRLKVQEGHPAGPVKKLEHFINSNIGSNGDPPFPDFHDVVKCVLESNTEDNLGWGKSVVINEACELFTQCGRALQKRRKQRAWRQLLNHVKMEDIEDPADHDPVLLAKLEQNRRIRDEKETRLLQRYSNLQTAPKSPLETNALAQETSTKLNVNSNKLNSINTFVVLNEVEVTKENNEIVNTNNNQEPPIAICFDNLNTNISSNLHHNNIIITQRNDEACREESCIPEEELKNAILNIKTCNDMINIKTCNDILNIKTCNDLDIKVKEEPVERVKKEPIDVVALLEQLGDNYTSNIISIEDPFLVIEISSDEES